MMKESAEAVEILLFIRLWYCHGRTKHRQEQYAEHEPERIERNPSDLSPPLQKMIPEIRDIHASKLLCPLQARLPPQIHAGRDPNPASENVVLHLRHREVFAAAAVQIV